MNRAFLAFSLPLIVSGLGCGDTDCDPSTDIEARAIFTNSVPLPYEVMFQATGRTAQRVVSPTAGVTAEPGDEVETAFRAECREGTLQDVDAAGVTHGACDTDGFDVPVTTTATVTLTREDLEWTDSRGMAFVTDEPQDCSAPLHGQLWLETESLTAE